MKTILQNLDFVTLLGFIAGLLTSISMLPQLIKTLKKKKAEDVSIIMLLVLLGGIILWISYGIIKKDYPIMITNSLSLLINVAMMILRFKYKK